MAGIMSKWPSQVRDRGPFGAVSVASYISAQGLPLSALDGLVELGYTTAELQAVINPRTLRHRRSREENLSVEESDRVIRLTRVALAAERVLGDRDRAWGWLRQKNPRLDGHTPMALLATETGARAVEEELVQIDEGMFG
jgi:putative toxin-antitoxin system antitoxin component (TIGR02293 family)